MTHEELREQIKDICNGWGKLDVRTDFILTKVAEAVKGIEILNNTGKSAIEVKYEPEDASIL